jgi:hypothetical protein
MPIPANDTYSEKLYKDVFDVFLGQTKKLSDFPEKYRDVLKNAYRFAGVRYETKYPKEALRTNATLDIV